MRIIFAFPGFRDDGGKKSGCGPVEKKDQVNLKEPIILSASCEYRG